MTVCGHSFCREGAQAMVLSAVRCVMLKLYPAPSQTLPILHNQWHLAWTVCLGRPYDRADFATPQATAQA